MAQTIETALRSINAYPIPSEQVGLVCLRRGLSPSAALTNVDLESEAFNLACADIYSWLADAPNVSQGGQNYSFSDEQRSGLRQKANALLDKYGKGNATIFGYKGSRL